MYKLKIFILLIFILNFKIDAQKSNKFDTWIYKVECHGETIDDFIAATLNGKISKCEQWDTLIDSENIKIPYYGIFVNENTIEFHKRHKNFNIYTEFYFDTITSNYSQLKFKKAWAFFDDSVCSDTVLYDTLSKGEGPYSEIKMNIKCPGNYIRISLYQNGLYYRLSDDTLEIKENNDFPRISKYKIPVMQLIKGNKSIRLTGLPDSGKPHLLNGGLGFFDTIQIKDTYDGRMGSTVYIQKNHKKPIYAQLEMEFAYFKKNGFYDYRELINKECTHKNRIDNIPTQWQRIFPYKNDLYIVYHYGSPLGGKYFLSDSSFIFSDIGWPKINTYTLYPPKLNTKTYVYTLVNKKDTLSQIFPLDSIKHFMDTSSIDNKKLFIPSSAIRNFDLIVQTGNCERQDKFTYGNFALRNAIKILIKKNINYVLVAN